MSRVRERHHELLEVLRDEIRREDGVVHPDERPPPPAEQDDARATEQGPEVEDLPLGVSGRPDELPELPGFPRGDPTHG
jgi:hypothetical protein